MSNTDQPVTICVDAAGGDAGVQVVLDGVAAALAADPCLTVVLTGPAADVEPFAAAHPGRAIAHPTTEVIGMGEHPVAAVRSKRDSSIVVGCRLVKEGAAQGFFSAGSTGAVMSAATLLIGRIRGIDRPGLANSFACEPPTVMLDLGANADCKPEYLVQFARMGMAYARIVNGVEAPRLGLLNIGSEDAKGSEFAQRCFALLREEVPEFVGNAEGGDLLSGRFDVIVTDGFTGNVCLKTGEGTAKFILGAIKAAAKGSLLGKLAGLVLKPSLLDLKSRLSGDDTGGAVLLGVRAPVVIGHGATSVDAVKNGALLVARSVRGGLVGRIEAACAVEQGC